MAIALLREGIRAWLEGQVRIDVWDLDLPANVPTVIDVEGVRRRFPANCAVEMPVQGLTLRRSGNQVEGVGRFVYALIYRFGSKAAKEQLPVHAVENLVNYLLQEAVAYPQELGDLVRSLAIASIEQPVSIARVEGEDGDWLIIGRLELDITFLSKAALEDVLQPPMDDGDGATVLSRVAITVNRAVSPVSPGDEETYTQDSEIILNL